MRTALLLILMLLASGVRAEITTALDVRSEQVKLIHGQHNTVGWYTKKIGANFNEALARKFASRGFGFANIPKSDFTFIVKAATLTLRRSGTLKVVDLSDLDDELQLTIPGRISSAGISEPTSATQGRASPSPDAATIRTLSSATGNPLTAVVGALVVAIGATAVAEQVESALGTENAGDEGLLRLEVLSVARGGGPRTEFFVSVISSTDTSVGALFDAAADGILQVLTRKGGEVVGGVTPAQGNGS